MALTTSTNKEQKKDKLLKILSDPDYQMGNRSDYAARLGISQPHLYTVFTPDDLAQIEKEALDLRRQKYASLISIVDRALINKAAEGDSQAAKLVYQRFEQWSEKANLAVSGDMAINVNIKRFTDAD